MLDGPVRLRGLVRFPIPFNWRFGWLVLWIPRKRVSGGSGWGGFRRGGSRLRSFAARADAAAGLAEAVEEAPVPDDVKHCAEHGVTLYPKFICENEPACGVAHARRKIFDQREDHPLLSSRFLAAYQELYDIEERAKGLSVREREELRSSEARPVWQRMRELLDGPAASGVLPKEKFAEALGYLRNQWDTLQVYLGDGRLPIDNNQTEQLMKQVAIGRKNWLFLGSVAAGERMADLMTLVSSALRNDLDVWAYVKDVLDRLLAGSTDYASLRPDRWAASHPEYLRTYRTDERRDRAAAQHSRRAHRRAAMRNPSQPPPGSATRSHLLSPFSAILTSVAFCRPTG
jgi:hypothetical protein